MRVLPAAHSLQPKAYSLQPAFHGKLPECTNRAIRLRVAALLADGERILVVRHRKAGQAYHLLPGGGVEFGETLPGALRREVLEETGLAIEVGRLLLSAETIFPGGGRHIVHLVYHAPSWSGTLRDGPEGERVEAVRWLPAHEWHDLPFLPDLRGPLGEQLRAGFGLPARHIAVPWLAVADD